MQTKTCTKCKVEKPLTEFHKAKNGKYGAVSRCSACVSEYQREHRSRPEVRERNRNQYREYRSEYFQRPEVREHRREYMREYNQRPEVRERDRERLRDARGMGLDYTSHLEIPAKYATRSGTPWSDAEVKFLTTSDLPLVDIALELGRSYQSVQMKLDKMRNDNIHTVSISNATRSRAQWSKTEDERLLAHKGALVDIALELGRSYDSVVKRRVKLLKSK